MEAGIATIATEVDHIIPRMAGGGDEPWNLQSLCHPHHYEKSIADRSGKSQQPSDLKSSLGGVA
jgi:5-methylcytosine-specific restriction protein A